MANLLSRLSRTSKPKPIEPREIFMTLPAKDKQYEYPRDVQSEVWKKWFANRQKQNAIIKMNTGSGKTVVALMILQSCLNEGIGPAVYVVPDKYLASQVCNEAKKLGIQATTDREDYYYTEHKAILVTPIHALVNGKSIFGMRDANNYPIGSILLDDVHACLDTITTQFSIQIPSSHPLYNKLLYILGTSWKAYDSASFTNIAVLSDPQKRALLPFWIWQEKYGDIYKLLKEYDSEEHPSVFFHLPLLEDILKLCNCIITSRSIEITPTGIPISKITSFENAKRRIFMSATLADDSVFVSAIGLKQHEISTIITPDKANDIGDRLILFPKHLNSMITDEEIKSQILSIAVHHNVVVIVPSRERGLYWDRTGTKLVTRDNIGDAVEKLTKQHVGLTVFVNRYDGIDLPDDACRMLVIDGLPPLRSEYDKYVQSINASSSLLLREQVQRIEQGMGRGVRSNSDSCCIVLMGNDLADVLLRNNGISFFSSATSEQYRLSKELWDLLKQEVSHPTVDDIFELAGYSLNREIDWIQKSKECLSTVTYKTEPCISNVSIALRTAFDYACVGHWTKAITALDSAINAEANVYGKGYLMQMKATYTNLFDHPAAQQILHSARSLNPGTLIPIQGIQYDKLIARSNQARNILEYVRRISDDPNLYLIYVSSVLDNLVFSPNAADFERTFKEIGELLGFPSSRPEKEISGKCPDNLWSIGNGKYLVVECKSGAVADTISKDYCNQLGGAVRWFYTEYGKDNQCVPVMVHKSNLLDDLATAVDHMRIITPDSLEKLKNQIRDFTAALVQCSNWNDEAQIGRLLSAYRLRGQDIVSEYSVQYEEH